MTICLILGLVVGLYALWLLFSLAVYALPVGVGIESAFALHACHCGFGAAILGGFVAGVATLALGRLFFASSQTPAVRAAVGGLFAFPAGVAGYHAALGIAGLVFGHGLLPGVICWLAAITIAVAAWRQIVLAEHNPVLAEQVRRAP